MRDVENELGTKHKTVEADQPWICSEQVLNPWSLRGKSQPQLVLAVVVSHVSRMFHRTVLRQTYDMQKSGDNFDLVFAVGHPAAGNVAQENLR
eukprot:gene26139-11860_t